MNLILIDNEANWKCLLPLTYTRPVAEIRIGILTIKEKWERYLKMKAGYSCKEYLSERFPASFKTGTPNLYIGSNILPDVKLASAIKKLKPNEGLRKGNTFIAYCTTQLAVEIANCKEYTG